MTYVRESVDHGRKTHQNNARPRRASPLRVAVDPRSKMATWDHHVLSPSPQRYRELHLSAAAKVRSEYRMGSWSPSSTSPRRMVPSPFSFEKPPTYSLRGNRYLVRGVAPKFEPLAPRLRPTTPDGATSDSYTNSLAQIYSGHQPPSSPRTAFASPRRTTKKQPSGLWPHQNDTGIKYSQRNKNASHWTEAGVSPPWTHPRGSFYPQQAPRLIEF